MKSSAGMAVGTLISRGTGFVRTLVLVDALGTAAVGAAYNNANNLPNTVYYLMLGGVFTSVIVPLLVRAAKRDPDHGEAYAQRVFVLGGPVAEFLLAHGHEPVTSARYIGEVFGLFSLGLVPYTLTQLQLRVFYSFQDSRTAALVGLFTMTVSIVGDVIAYGMLPASQVVAGMAVAFGAANLIGAIVGWILLLRRVGSLDGWSVARALGRMHLASLPGLIWAVFVILAFAHVMHSPSQAYGIVVTLIGGGGAVLLYAFCARRLRVAELGFLMRTIAGRFGGQSSRR